MTAPRAQAAHENLLPEATRGFFTVASMPEFNAQWAKTQIGKLMADPAMQPFAKDLRRQLDEKFASMYARLGITLDDMQGVPGGEATIGLVQLSEDQATRIILMDITGKRDQANQMLARAEANLLKAGASKSTSTFAGAQLLIYTEPSQGGTALQTVYFVKDNLLGAGENLAVIQGILNRVGGATGDSLGETGAFKQCMARCQKDAGSKAPLVRWWIQPLGYAEAERAITPVENRRHGKPLYKLLRNQGFAAIQGMGGFIDLNAAQYEVLHRTAVFAPPPYEKSMKMLVFPNTEGFLPERFVPRDVATYSTLYCDILNAFDNFGPLYDEVFGEGQTGAWKDVLEAFKTDPHGPRLDLRRDLMAHLKQRITIVTDYKLPIDVDSERLVYAIETKDDKAVASAIARWMHNDPTAKRREWHDLVIWEMVEAEDKHEIPEISLEVPNQPKRHIGRHANRENPPLLPHAAVTVTQGHLFIASHMDFLQKILTQVAERKTLAKDIDYNQVREEIGKLGLPHQCFEGFSFVDEEFRPTYELIRQGKMPQSQSLLGKALNAFFNDGKKNVTRKQQIDGSKAPDFEIVRRSLGTSGIAAASESDGWFVKGFLLPKAAK